MYVANLLMLVPQWKQVLGDSNIELLLGKWLIKTSHILSSLQVLQMMNNEGFNGQVMIDTLDRITWWIHSIDTLNQYLS